MMILPLRTNLIGLSLTTAVLAAMTPCHGADATLAPAVKQAIGGVRDNRAGVYDVFESSTLGTTARPAEYAAAQRNLRQHYLTPAEPLKLSAARQAELAALYGRVALVGAPRCAKAFALGITGASVIDVDGRPELTVTGVEPGSPADGKLEAGDVIRTVLGGHAERIFASGWSGVGAHLAPQPEFRMYADNMLWYYELARQRSGALTDLGHTRYKKSTAAVGMMFTLPGKRLRIAGGPRRTEPLFPIAKLEGIQVAPPQPVAEWQPVQPAAPDDKKDAAETWDTLLAADGGGSSVTIGNDPAGTPLRATFQCRKPGYTKLRLTLPVGVGGEMFLNGSRVMFFPAVVARGGPPTHTIDLGERATGALVRGENLLTATLTGKPGTAVAIDLAAGPGTIDKRTIAASPGNFGNFRRDGWVGTFQQHRQSVDWFFADKSPEEIARYLPCPDWNGAQAAYQALAACGPAAVSLLERLVEDSHEGIRAGGWDAIARVYVDRDESKQVLASLGEFFDTVAYRQRGTFMFRAIGTATELAQAQLAAPGGTDTHTLARGLCKTYATSANFVWYSATRDQLHKVVTPLATSSPKAAAEAATAIQAWMNEAPKEEKDAVFEYMQKLSAADVTQRLAELTKEKP